MAIRFAYPIEFTLLPDYSAHRGQEVEILRQLTDEECDPECQPMYLIQAADGWQGHASIDELDSIADVYLKEPSNAHN